MSDIVNSGQEQDDHSEKVISLSGMYENYFLDYASYVILERAVPAIEDGFKPVQRRFLHAMKEMDDGRYHKVANIIGQTMQYHPHGDAAIGAALVNVGQKDLLIDCQGNWGDTRTGDRAAAARYIEARLSKFALDVLFNAKTTEWKLSYDGRNREPITLPVKFPMVLAQGVEGIAVGLSTKILPHNFIELIKASIAILKKKPFKLYPDFEQGGMIDVTNYNKGKRGGKVRVRSSIEQLDKKTLVIKQLPYGVTTTNLIDSVIKANDKGKIKIKKITDNTAAKVEILIELPSGVSPTMTIDALYAFTNCEVSISPNTCIIRNDKPLFLTVDEAILISTARTKGYLKQELEIRLSELEEKWHFSSLEKIFIERKIYRRIEECETWEAVIEAIDKGLKRHIKHLKRPVTTDDIVRLTEIKIKRISKFNSFKADEIIAVLEKEMEEILHHLAHLTDYAVAYFENLLKKYGKGRERRTKIMEFDTIRATQVVANNAKLYVNKKTGFIGTGLKKEEFVSDCSDIDNIIIFRKDGKYLVTKVDDKKFVGKDIIHIAVWKKGDERTTYNTAYSDGKTGRSFSKRFHVKAITRDREYDITQGSKNSKLLYFSANPNGESEIIGIQLTQASTAKIKKYDYDYSELAIKGRTGKGNLLSKFPIRKIIQKSLGKSTLGAKKIWIDEVSGRLNTAKRGRLLGEFDTGDSILVLYNDGSYKLTDFELTNRYELDELVRVEKFNPETVISAVYYEGERKASYAKRFKIETSTLGQRFVYITETRSSKLLLVTTNPKPHIEFSMRVKSKTMNGDMKLVDFIDVKGWKSLGKKLSDHKLRTVKEKVVLPPTNGMVKPGDTMNLDF